MKKCSKCKIEKSLTQFFVSRKGRSKDGKHNVCKECCVKYQKDYRNTPEGKEKYKNWWYTSKLRSKFGITVDEYENLLQKQDNRCAICGKYSTIKGQRLAIDHNHLTKKVRGLLCHHCNVGIGYMRENIQTLKNAIEYLERNTGL